ncbi:MAG: hypothetical protein NXI04_17320 [Planctomycetaceae bacterium]|nr:hypothetical protein [Planctomycetaceae bacterium]
MHGHQQNRIWRLWTHSSTAVMLMAGFGLLIGSVMASLGGGRYQTHVSMFHPHSPVYHKVAAMFGYLLPFAPAVALLTPVYFCVRVGRHFDYILLLGLLGWLAAVPVANGSGYLPATFGCSMGAFAGVLVQKFRDHPRDG